MTESGKVHSNFTVIIIANFQETVKHQSLRNCGGCLLLFCVTLWHMSIRVALLISLLISSAAAREPRIFSGFGPSGTKTTAINHFSLIIARKRSGALATLAEIVYNRKS